MKAFMDRDFLLSTDTARHLYHDIAADLPIIDYHCHLSPRDIYEDKKFHNLTELWLYGDHYKWRLMRSFGVEEQYITGAAPDREKFQKWAECLGLAVGNPLYHWSHLELRNYFGYDGVLNADTADAVWSIANERLQSPEFSARSLIRRSNVRVLCTTDDPADTLEWHKKITADNFDVTVLPTFRPDRAISIEKKDYPDYLAKLGSPNCYAALKDVLKEKITFFSSMGCRISDHSLDAIPYVPASDREVETIFQKRLNGESLTEREIRMFKTSLLLFLGSTYRSTDWAMQIHYGVIRDNAKRLYRALGADAGIDSIGDAASVSSLAAFLNALDETDALPRTILYSLDPNDNAAIETVIGAFQTPMAYGKMQHGSAWWFNDHYDGIRAHLKSLAAEGALATFVGMLTDSRSFLSYARHEYFRRILCALLGEWVENGEFPNDEKILRKIVEDICFKNAEQYFHITGGES